MFIFMSAVGYYKRRPEGLLGGFQKSIPNETTHETQDSLRKTFQ